MNNVSTDMDFQDTVRAAALAFLERHQAEHLNDSVRLIDRATVHVIERFDINKPTATRIVFLAHGDLMTIWCRHRVDMSASSETSVVIADPKRGTSWSIDVDLICEHLISAGLGKRITPAS